MKSEHEITLNVKPGDKPLSIDEAASLSAVNRRTITEALRAEELKAYYVGKRIRILLSDLQAWWATKPVTAVSADTGITEKTKNDQ